jgi:hypothetical protein
LEGGKIDVILEPKQDAIWKVLWQTMTLFVAVAVWQTSAASLSGKSGLEC